jgi:hypothetical protein
METPVIQELFVDKRPGLGNETGVFVALLQCPSAPRGSAILALFGALHGGRADVMRGDSLSMRP